jgi:hypothetical protein
MIKERVKMGLPELPQSKPDWSQVMKEVVAIIEATKYDRLLGITSKEGDE